MYLFNSFILRRVFGIAAVANSDNVFEEGVSKKDVPAVPSKSDPVRVQGGHSRRPPTPAFVSDEFSSDNIEHLFRTTSTSTSEEKERTTATMPTDLRGGGGLTLLDCFLHMDHY